MFLRVVNGSYELSQLGQLYRSLQQRFPKSRVRLLALVDLQAAKCVGEGSPTKIDYRKKWVPTSSNLSTGGPSLSLEVLLCKNHMSHNQSPGIDEG